MADDEDLLGYHNADLWALSFGFIDASELKEWGEQMERERLTEQTSNKLPNNLHKLSTLP